MSSEEQNVYSDNVERRVNCREMENRVNRLEYWRDGNGSKGAEQRLQSIETKVNIIIVMLGITVGENVIAFVIGLL